ncbi:hypothetical protein ABK040_016257 [Willaertia magna]
MAEEAYNLWKEIEKVENFFKEIGGLDIGRKDSLQKILNVMKERNLSHEILTADVIRKKFIEFNNISDEYIAIYQKNSGILNPNKVREIMLKKRREFHDIMEETKVIEIKELIDYSSFEITVLNTNKETILIKTKKLIICVGAWTKQFLKQHFKINIKFEAQRISYYYWKINKEIIQKKLKEEKQEELKEEKLSIQQLPIWIFWGYDPSFKEENVDFGFYGFPEYEMEGYLKTAIHYPHGEEERDIDPEERAKLIDEGKESKVPRFKIERMKSFLSHMSNENYLDLNESYEEIIKKEGRIVTCLYEMTPTEDFIIDYIPTERYKQNGIKNCVIFGGGSGHAFKFGSLLGKMLLDLLQNTNNNEMILEKYPIKKFSLQNVME